jgi:rhomboid family GlyGly-CTERM serine protease
MISPSDDNRPARHYAVPCVITLFCLLLLLPAMHPWREALAYTTIGIAQGQYWRLFTGHLVHLGPVHALLNLGALWLLFTVAPQRRPSYWLAQYLWLALGTGVCLYGWAPQWTHYVGLSGVLHGFFITALLPLLRGRDPIAWGMLLLMGAKLLWELTGTNSTSTGIPIGGPIVTEAHRYGALCGALWAVSFLIYRRVHRR